ncbi:hypothetical protein D7X33_25525 [Butyricicoccus sp. 1XD8-22]|nr:hypothetical protein D7X33_25525 [Butyricicoccus sp. 1XD8-22]
MTKRFVIKHSVHEPNPYALVPDDYIDVESFDTLEEARDFCLNYYNLKPVETDEMLFYIELEFQDRISYSEIFDTDVYDIEEILYKEDHDDSN